MPPSNIFDRFTSKSSSTEPSTPSTDDAVSQPISTATAVSTAAGQVSPNPNLPTTFTDGKPFPRVVVFDLDYTLWPFWCDTHPDPPFKAIPGNLKACKDRNGQTQAFYKDVPEILCALKERGVRVGVASRTSASDIALQLLSLLHVPSPGENKKLVPAKGMFDSLQIYTGDKTRHNTVIRKELNKKFAEREGEIQFSDMLFFDDESRNGNVERELGVCFQLVHHGVTRKDFDRGVEKWRAMRGVEGGNSNGVKGKKGRKLDREDIGDMDYEDSPLDARY